MDFRILPIRPDFLDLVRNQGVDDQGQPVKRLIAEGGEPCRDVLRRARPGEALILASYCPFSEAGPYREYGPVFVLAQPSDEEVVRDQLPTAEPQHYLRKPFVLRAYSHEQSIFDAEFVEPETADEVLQRFLALPEVAFVDARFPAYGCFSCRIQRVE